MLMEEGKSVTPTILRNSTWSELEIIVLSTIGFLRKLCAPRVDRKYEITEEFVVYENILCSPIRIVGFNKLNNTEGNLEKVLLFGQPNTVLTSSYHGAYWQPCWEEM